MRPYFLLFLSLFVTIEGYSQRGTQKDPIDKSYEDCLAKDTSAANIGNCAFQAYAKWDKELNKYYNKLLKETKKEKDKNALINSEKAWIAWRDAEFASYDYMFDRSGTKWTRIRADNRIAIVKERVQQLRSYYDSITKH